MHGGELTGRLLVATPMIGDPNFSRTVVLVLAHGDEGAFGVVLNRPSQREAAELIPAWGERAAPPSVMFLGGPVAPNAVVALGLVESEHPAVDRGEPVVGRLVTVDLNKPPEEAGPGIGALRLFAGSAGWSAGQLEAEVEEGAWWVIDALPADAFDGEPEQLWTRVLRRQGPPLAFAASYPEDPTLN